MVWLINLTTNILSISPRTTYYRNKNLVITFKRLRHSIAMGYLNSGCQYEDVAGVLGDTIATIEKHYSELIFTPAREAAWRKAHCFATKISSEGTAQPAFLMRDGGFRMHPSNFRTASNSGVVDSSRVVDAVGFEPTAAWLQTKRSSS